MITELFQLYRQRKDFFLELLLQHIKIALFVGIIAGIIGLLIGVFISQKKKLAPLIIGIINVIYTIPSISMLGFLIPFTGIGDKTAIIALIIYGLLPMVRNTYTGINGIDDSIIEAAKAMGSTSFQILYKIKLPLAFPVILSGFRNMIVMTISISSISSFIGAGGLGVAVYRGITTNNAKMTMAGSLLIALLALVCDTVIGRYEKRILKKRRVKQ